MILRLHPDVVVAWRGARTLQIGLDARHGVVLADLTETQERLVQAMVRGEHTRDGLRRLARRLGLGDDEVDALLTPLLARGMLLDGEAASPMGDPSTAAEAAAARALSLRHPGAGWAVLHERRRRTVLLLGAGPLAVRVARGLHRAGVRRLLVADESPVRASDLEDAGVYTADDLGRRRQHVAAERLPGVRTAPPHPEVDLALVHAEGAVTPSSTDGLLRDDIAHLPVVLRERDAVVGPLVVPGRTCCLRCLDLYRCDRDQEWPVVAGQAAGHPFPARDPLLLDLVAATATAQALDALDGRVTPLTEGVGIELSLDDPVPMLRRWPAHPRCGCTWPPPGTLRTG